MYVWSVPSKMVEDVELCLEVQVDPASKKILSNPEKCRSTLLDVTVVKPKELEGFGTQRTNTLTAVEVRKLISSLEKQRRRKQKVIDKLKYDNTIIKVRKHENFNNTHDSSATGASKRKEKLSSMFPLDDLERKDFIGITESVEPLFCEIKKSLKNVETRITNMQDINLMISESTANESASEEYETAKRKKRNTAFTNCNHSSVFRAETAPHDLKSILVGENKNYHQKGHNKIEGKCLCENCGIVGLLVDCQKHPLISEVSESPYSYCTGVRDKRKKTKFFMSNYDNPHTKLNDSYMTHLSKRVQHLEDRLALQEEKVVAKDYFKKMMSKVVTSFTPNKELKTKNNMSIFDFETQQKKKDDKQNKSSSLATDRLYHNHSRETVTTEKSHNRSTAKEPKRVRCKNDKGTLTENDFAYNEYVWKWGEEILKPGIDLKNRIVTLLNDILSRFVLREKYSNRNLNENERRENFKKETIKQIMEEVNTRVFTDSLDPKEGSLIKDKYHMSGDHNKLNFDFYYTPTTTTKKEERKDCFNFYDKRKIPRKHEEKKDNTKNVDISYVNPKLYSPQKDSIGDFKQEEVQHNGNPYKGKYEFLKIVSRAKQHQKDTLWRNIWTEAKANDQGKNDMITVKIPVANKNTSKNEMFETELSIGEVEAILKGYY